MPGRSPYRQALLTYWRRPAFRAVILLLLIDAALWTIFVTLNDRLYAYAPRIDPWGVLGGIVFLTQVVAVLSPEILLIAFVALLMQHLRFQLENQAFELLPRSRGVHLVVGLSVLIVLPVAITGALFVEALLFDLAHSSSKPALFAAELTSNLLGGLAVMLSLIVLTAAWAAFHKPWFSVLVFPLLILAFYSERFEALVGTLLGAVPPKDVSHHILYELQIIAIDLLILLGVGFRLARRPGLANARPRRRFRSDSVTASEPISFAHRPLFTPLARAWHRRHGVLNPLAPWAVAIILALGLIAATLFTGHRQSDLLRAVLFPTVVPGVVISLIWRERWGNLGYESLYPAGRADFVSELAVATAIQLAELWLATAFAAIVPIAVWEPSLLASPIVCAAILASAAMQFMVFGVMFVAALFRGALLYVNLLTILAALIPITFAWADKPLLSPRGLLVVAIVQMACGIALTAFGSMAWRRRDLA